MFDHFKFATQAQAQHQLLDHPLPSPADTSFPSPPPSFPFPISHTAAPEGINDIVTKFSEQSLLSLQSRDQLMVHQLQAWCGSSSCADDEDEKEQETNAHGCNDQSIHTAAAVSEMPKTPPRMSPRARVDDDGDDARSRRLQGQHNVQLQSSPAPIRDIDALVKDIVVSNLQCSLQGSTSHAHLSPAPSPAPSPSPEDKANELIADPAEWVHGEVLTVDDGADDEGFYEGRNWGWEEDMETWMTLRRAGTPSGIRKYNGLSFRRTVDLLASGRRLVRSVPRMRKRKRKT